MWGLTPFWWMLGLGALCSAGAITMETLAQPFHVEAVQPSSERSAGPAATGGSSNVVQTVVTKATPTPEPSQPPSASPTEEATAAPVATPSEQVTGLRSGISPPTMLVPDPAKASALLSLMNGARAKNGLAALETSEELDVVALARARNLIAIGYFDHYSPDGESAFSELAARGIPYRLAGENLARNNYPEPRTVAAAFEGLMASAGHRGNIMEERFSAAGVAVVPNGRMWVYVTVFTN